MKKFVVRKDDGAILGVGINRRERRKITREKKLLGQVVVMAMEHYRFFAAYAVEALKVGAMRPV